MTPRKRANQGDLSAPSASGSVAVGVISDRRDVLDSVRYALPGTEVRHLSQVSDARAVYDCKAFVLDTSVSDTADWPSVAASAPHLAKLPWVFLVSGLDDVNRLSPVPADSTFTDSPSRVLSLISSRLKAKLDPQAGRSIASVTYGNAAHAFAVRMGNGKSYSLLLDDIPETDETTVKNVRISKDKRYFVLTQASGNSVDVPWDTVLYHCEPDYEHDKGRAKHDEESSATRIGQRVLTLRTERGLTAADLASRAGMHRPNLSRLEAGKHMPSLETLEKVADALGVPVVDLVAV